MRSLVTIHLICGGVLLWGKDYLLMGLHWRVARNSHVSVFRDPWLLRPHLFKPISVHNPNLALLRVGKMNEMVSRIGKLWTVYYGRWITKSYANSN